MDGNLKCGVVGIKEITSKTGNFAELENQSKECSNTV